MGQFTAAEHNGGLDLISAFKETNGIFGLDIKVVFFNADTQFDFLYVNGLLTLAGFTTVITAYRPEAVAAEVQNLIAEHGVTELVLGHPLNMDGTRGPRAEKAEGFAALLRETTGLPVTLWDERRTTVDAHNILMAGGKNAKQRKKTVDAVAASLMLEGYLTFKKRQK